MTNADSTDSGGSKISQWEAMSFVWELLFLITVPTLVFALGGRWIDSRYGLSPWGTLLGLFLALTSCTVVVLKRGSRMAKRMKRDSSKDA